MTEFYESRPPKTLSQIKQQISTKDIDFLMKWFVESYDDGWRPLIRVEKSLQEKRELMDRLRE